MGCQRRAGLKSVQFSAKILASFFFSSYFQHNNMNFALLKHTVFFSYEKVC